MAEGTERSRSKPAFSIRESFSRRRQQHGTTAHADSAELPSAALSQSIVRTRAVSVGRPRTSRSAGASPIRVQGSFSARSRSQSVSLTAREPPVFAHADQPRHASTPPATPSPGASSPRLAQLASTPPPLLLAPEPAETPPTGPLFVHLLTPRDGRTNGAAGWEPPIAVGINEPTALPLEAEQFAGRALFLLQRGSAEALPPHAREFFALRGNERLRFEIQVQGRLRAGAGGVPRQVASQPLQQLWLGIELEEPLSLGFLTRGVCSTALRVLKAISKGALHASWGSGPVGTQPAAGTAVELPHLAVPFSYVKCLVTPDGEQPPELGAEASKAMARAAEASKAQAAGASGDADGGGTLTFGYSSSFLDPIRWVISGLGSLPPLSLHDILGEQPVYISVYSLRTESSAAETLHSEERKHVYMRFRVAHAHNAAGGTSAPTSASSSHASSRPSSANSRAAARPPPVAKPSGAPPKVASARAGGEAAGEAADAERDMSPLTVRSASVTSTAPSGSTPVRAPRPAGVAGGGGAAASAGGAAGGGASSSSSIPWWLSALLEPLASVTGRGGAHAQPAESEDDDSDDEYADGAVARAVSAVEMDELELSLAFDTHGPEGGMGIDVEQEAAALAILPEADEEEYGELSHDDESHDEEEQADDGADGPDGADGADGLTQGMRGRLGVLTNRIPFKGRFPKPPRLRRRPQDGAESAPVGAEWVGVRLRAVACVRTARAAFQYLLVLDRDARATAGARGASPAAVGVGTAGGAARCEWEPVRFVLVSLREMSAVVRATPTARAAYDVSLRRTELSHAPLRRQLAALNAAFSACAEQMDGSDPAGPRIARALGGEGHAQQLRFLEPREDGAKAFGFSARAQRRALRNAAYAHAKLGAAAAAEPSGVPTATGAAAAAAAAAAGGGGGGGGGGSGGGFLISAPVLRCEWEGYMLEEWGVLTSASLLFVHRAEQAPAVRTGLRERAKAAMILLSNTFERSTRRTPRAPWQPQWAPAGGAAAAVGGAGGAVDPGRRQRRPRRAHTLEIPLDAVLAVEPLAPADGARIVPGLSFWAIETVGRRHYLATRDEASSARWVGALRERLAAVRAARGGVEPPLRLLMPATLALSAPQFRPPSRVLLNQKALVWRPPYEPARAQRVSAAKAAVGPAPAPATPQSPRADGATSKPADDEGGGQGAAAVSRMNQMLSGLFGFASAGAEEAAEASSPRAAPPPPPRHHPPAETARPAAGATPAAGAPPSSQPAAPSQSDAAATGSARAGLPAAASSLRPVVLYGHPAADVHAHSAALLASAIELLGAQEAATATAARLAALHDSASQLKGCSLARLAPCDFTATCLNVYHALIVHRLVMLGPPRSQREFSAMHRNTSYEVGGEALCPLEIEQFLRQSRARGVPKPRAADVGSSRITAAAKQAASWAWSKAAPALAAERSDPRSPSPPFSAAQRAQPAAASEEPLVRALFDQPSPTKARPPAAGEPSGVDPRISLALNTGSRSCLHTIAVFDGATLERALSAYASELLDSTVHMYEDGGVGGSALVVLPKVVEWHARDFLSAAAAAGLLAESTSELQAEPSAADVLAGVATLFSRPLHERYVRLHTLASLSGLAITVRYAPHDFKCHPMLRRWALDATGPTS